jgi:hypothetical protein
MSARGTAGKGGSDVKVKGYNGEGTDYRIDVEPSGSGHFISFTTRSGYSAGGFTNGRTGRIILSG